jgi:hypothetical protein
MIMSTPELTPDDGDPTENPAAELAPGQRAQSDDAGAPRTEHPLPESSPSGGADA